MQVRRDPISRKINMTDASAAEAHLVLQSVRHEMIRVERRIADPLLGEETRQTEKDNLGMLKGINSYIGKLFASSATEG